MDKDFEKVFKNVPQILRDEYLNFIQIHPWKSLEVNGFKWHYMDLGSSSSQTIIVVPGGMRCPTIGWRLLQNLECKYRVIAPAYPTTESMNTLAQGILAIADFEGIEKFSILGSSFGGLVVQTLLQHASERITHAIISNTGTVIIDKKFAKRIRRTIQIMSILPGFIVTRIARNSFKRLLTSIQNERVIYEALVDELFARKWLTKKEMVCHFGGLLDFQVNQRFTSEETQKWNTKLMVIKSSDDPGVGRASSDALDRMFPSARTHIFNNAGHMPSITRASEYLSIIEEVLHQ